MSWNFSLVDDLTCHRCAGPLLCTLTIPHSFLRADGVEVRGERTVGLCPVCDAENPAGRAMVAHFSGNGETASAPVDEVATLLREWSVEVFCADVTAAL